MESWISSSDDEYGFSGLSLERVQGYDVPAEGSERSGK